MLESEHDWLTRPHPAELLRHVEKAATPRKLRLFVCHCCHRLGPLLSQGGVREALAAAERFADGRASPEELRAGWVAIRRALAKAPLTTKWEQALDAALHACSPEMSFWDVLFVSREAARARGGDWLDASSQYFPDRPEGLVDPPRLQECAFQCAVARDLFAYHPVRVPAGLRAWEGGLLTRIARGMYEGERFDELPVLADALEEAGCDDPQLLGHARSPGPHFKGCWLLDALAGWG